MQFDALGTINLWKLLQVLKPMLIGFGRIAHIYLPDAATLDADHHIAVEGLLIIVFRTRCY